VFSDLRIDQLTDMDLKPFVRPFLICPHKPRVSRHVGSKDRGEAVNRGMARPAVRCI
jgi:hypothetical protein